MKSNMLTFEEYIHDCKPRLSEWKRSNSIQQVIVVIGNEAMDLDSMVSSLVCAYFLSVTSNGQEFVIPVLNLPRGEMRLRKDNLLALERSGLVSDSALIYADEVDLDNILQQDKLGLVLVDHNFISPRRKPLEKAVIRVIDHHEDSGKHQNAERNIRVPVGSCSSLITEIIFDSPHNKILETPALNLLLRMAIIIDTKNLGDTFKTTTLDRQMMTLLDRFYNGGPKASKLFQELNNARLDMKGLTPIELLRKDVKYDEDEEGRFLYSMSTIKAKLSEVGIKGSEVLFMKDIIDFMNDPVAQLDACFVLSQKDTFSIELLSAFRDTSKYSNDPFEVVSAELAKGKAYQGTKIKGSPEKSWPSKLAEDSDVRFMGFSVKKPISRKQIQPFLRDAFSML